MVLNLYQALIDELPDGTPLTLGLETAAEYSAPPRIVMIPVRDDYTKSESVRTNSKPLWKRTAAFQVDLWADGYDTVEGLVEDFLTALDVVAPSATVSSGSWIFDEGWLTAGQAYRIEFSLETFVLTQEQYSTIEQVVMSCKGINNAQS